MAYSECDAVTDRDKTTAHALRNTDQIKSSVSVNLYCFDRLWTLLNTIACFVSSSTFARTCLLTVLLFSVPSSSKWSICIYGFTRALSLHCGRGIIQSIFHPLPERLKVLAHGSNKGHMNTASDLPQVRWSQVTDTSHMSHVLHWLIDLNWHTCGTFDTH